MGLSDKTGRDGTGASKWKSKHKTISWSGGPPESLRDAIGAITDNGAAVLFSRTPDGGALVFKVFAGTDTTKEYVTELGDIIALLSWAVETYG